MLLGVDKFVDYRFNQEFGRWERLVSWQRLQSIEDSWEPLTDLLQDVPTKVRDYINSIDDEDLRRQLE
ncbi:unnamed protein product [Phytophthora fragariaefolia]|uniref:Unnamed protein product n=1 Tax=Phytophthora fragariaefolia TaxID=1490495 RepID=A0A9W7DBJ6_9STRA|nr:unnamed protein product [Phytophthora fragariaefolia]